MKELFIILFVFSLGNFGHTSPKIKFSEIGHACSKSDPNMGECIKKTATEDVLPKLVQGIRALGIFPADPLFVPFNQIYESQRNIGLKLNITNAHHYGVKNLMFRDFKFSGSGDKKHYKFVGRFENYSINGTCETSGTILEVPVSGYGPCNLSANGIDMIATITTRDTKRKGVEYCEMENVHLKYKFAGGGFVLRGLFNGNKDLEDTLNNFINENALRILNQFAPVLEKTCALIIHNILKRFFNKLPCNELMLP